MKVRIYVANLGAYNEGRLKGAWFTLPMDLDDIFKKVFSAHELDENGNPHGDWAIHDCEAPFPISEYDSIEKLNEIAELFTELTDSEIETLLALKDHGAINEFSRDELENIIAYDACKDMGDVAYQIVQEQYSSSDEYTFFLRHFDYDSFGEELESSGTYIEVNDELIVEYTG